MGLSDWHHRLDAHFSGLRAARTQLRGAGAPIFALEHGLDTSAAQSLSDDIRVSVKAGELGGDTLPWVIYATELGYRYSGDEYWQTFEEETPGWTLYGRREWIRHCFNDFCRRYGAARPSGPWASQFSIICWPITHAILPRDLQRQLARILYEIRYSFSSELLRSPLLLGERIAARSWEATSRFQNLAQETLLIGQLAAALLLEGELGSDGHLLPATLRRIGQDLDREQRAREWLRSARGLARARARFQGVANVPTSPTRGGVAGARDTVAALGIEPSVFLRPCDVAGTKWTVHLQIPDLSRLILKFPELRQTLMQSRCKVAGAVGAPLARRRVFGGTDVTLERWPRSDEVLLGFEQSTPELSYLLRTECLLRPGPTWLFRIASDGLAYEIRGFQVRPGQKYLILGTSLSNRGVASQVTIDCDGVVGASLALPDALSDAWSHTLSGLGLGQARTVRVSPAGLAAAAWDDEGRAEWLVDDPICIELRADHDCPTLSLEVQPSGSPEPLILNSLPAGKPLFVRIPELPAGMHTLILRRIETQGERERLGELEIVVREPRAWTMDIPPNGPASLDVIPESPTLEDLWSGEATISVRGPAGRRAGCVINLFERDPDRASFSKTLPPLELPILGSAWADYFDRHVRNSSDFQNRYDVARACELVFGADELGTFRLRCEREFSPLRWIVKQDQNGHVLTLVDDSGDPTPPEVASYAFETPDRQELLNMALVPVPFRVPADGGLYVARRADFVRAVLLPPHRIGLAELRARPRVELDRGRSAERILDIIGLAATWSNARLTGNSLGLHRRREVLRRFARYLFFMLCGDTWERAELECERADSISPFEFAVRGRPDDSKLIRLLKDDLGAIEAESCDARVRRLGSLIKSTLRLQVPMAGEVRGPCGTVLQKQDKEDPKHPEWLSECALRMASEPGCVPQWAGAHLLEGIRILLSLPAIPRAARFLALAIDRRTTPSALDPRSVYAGWKWESRR